MSKPRKVVSRKPYVGKQNSAWIALAYILQNEIILCASYRPCLSGSICFKNLIDGIGNFSKRIINMSSKDYRLVFQSSLHPVANMCQLAESISSSPPIPPPIPIKLSCRGEMAHFFISSSFKFPNSPPFFLVATKKHPFSPQMKGEFHLRQYSAPHHNCLLLPPLTTG